MELDIFLDGPQRTVSTPLQGALDAEPDTGKHNAIACAHFKRVIARCDLDPDPRIPSDRMAIRWPRWILVSVIKEIVTTPELMLEFSSVIERIKSRRNMTSLIVSGIESKAIIARFEAIHAPKQDAPLQRAGKIQKETSIP